MKSTRPLLLIGLPVVAIACFFIFRKPSDSIPAGDLMAKAAIAPMAITIHAPGELQAKRSEKIKGPEGLRTVNIYQITISSLVPEGTVVQQGQFIASLDPTELDGKIKESQTEIEKIQTQLDQAKIDTAIEMRSLRDDFVNINFSMKEKELSLELSKYEPQAIIQQSKLDLEKAQRELDQLGSKLKLTKEKSVAKIEEINASQRQQQFKLDRLLELQTQMTVTAPKGGMVIYVRDWNGKRGPGSQVSSWDPTIAELPDLSEMITKAYINEVDISQVILGQRAKISLDAFPGKEFKGVVISKANIGEQVRNFDTKVFEVVIQLSSIDSLLRPAMTTGLDILVDSVASCLQVPLESIQTDSVSYVFLKSSSGFIRQEVVTGPSNEMSICLGAGVKEGDDISINAPPDAEKLDFVYLNAAVKKTALEKFEKEKAERIKAQQEVAKTIKAENLSGDSDDGGSFFIF